MMWPIRRFLVRKQERGLLFAQGDFKGFLGPGTYWRLDPWKQLSVEVYDPSVPAFRSGQADFLVKMCPADVRERFEVVSTQADQVAVIYLNGRLQEVLGPNQRALYRKGVAEVTATVIDIGESFRVERPVARVLVSGETERPTLASMFAASASRT